MDQHISLKSDIKNHILKANNILIISPTNLDGDSIGSTLALFLVLQKLGKQVTAICETETPPQFSFLPQSPDIKHVFDANRDFIITVDCSNINIEKMKYNRNAEENKVNIVITPKDGDLSPSQISFSKGGSNFDLAITVDTPSIKLLGSFYADNKQLFDEIKFINIDHHASNTNFADINLVDPTASSATHIITGLIESMSEGRDNLIDEDIATCLLTGIITDTGSFQNANTSPKALATSATLLARGARQQEIINNLFRSRKLNTLRLWGLILQKIQEDTEAKIIWSSATKEDFESTHTTPADKGEIIDELLTSEPNAEVVLLIYETDKGVNGSIRTTKDNKKASQIAELFGGGGHVKAAGFHIAGKTIKETEAMIIEQIRTVQISSSKPKFTSFEPENNNDNNGNTNDNENNDNCFTIPEQNNNTGAADLKSQPTQNSSTFAKPNITEPTSDTHSDSDKQASKPYNETSEIRFISQDDSNDDSETTNDITEKPKQQHSSIPYSELKQQSEISRQELSLEQLQNLDPPKQGFNPKREMKGWN